MNDEYRTMKLLKAKPSGIDWHKGLFQCQVCHGVVYDLDAEHHSDDESIRRRVAGMTCSLCDESAPLSKRYWMALATLACSVRRGYRGQGWSGSRFGFPSFRWICTCKYDAYEIAAEFDYGNALVTAGLEGITTERIGRLGPEDVFLDYLDGKTPRLDSRRMALELVNRVRHDLELKYESKEA